MVKFTFFVHCKGYKEGGYHNTHFAYDEDDAKRCIAEWNKIEQHVDLISVTEITDEEFKEDYICF